MKENESRSCFSQQKLCLSVCVCVCALRKHLHQKQTWVWASDPCEERSVLPSGCCLSNDFILQVDV